MARKRNHNIKIVNDGQKIFLFKKGSRGEVVGVYDSINEIVRLEKPFNNSFNYSHIYNILSGKAKTFASFYHGCRVKAVVKSFDESSL